MRPPMSQDRRDEERPAGDISPAAVSHGPLLERPTQAPPGLRRLARDFGGHYAANGVVGLIFACTGPVAVILAVGVQGGLSRDQLASWIFGVFFLNGFLTLLASWLYRQPL